MVRMLWVLLTYEEVGVLMCLVVCGVGVEVGEGAIYFYLFFT